MVYKINDDDEPVVKLNGTSVTSTKPSTSSSNYYPNEKAQRSSSSSSSSASSDSEASSDFEHSYKSLSSRIGTEFQVDLTEYEPSKFSQKDIRLKETLVWKPYSTISDSDLENFISTACNKHSYRIDQALALLCWDNFDIQKAYLHMKRYVPQPNEWTEEDKILFEQAYMFHGKNFTKIKQVLPDKSQASLVCFYYMWKKGRQYTSLIDSNQQGNKTNDQVNNNDLTESNYKEDDLASQLNDENEDDDTNYQNNVNKICCNCDAIINDLQSTPKGMLCGSCYVYWKDTGGLMRPDMASESNGIFTSNSSSITRGHNVAVNNSREAKNFQKSLRKPPKGIYLNYEELVNLVEHDSYQTFEMLTKKLNCLKKEVQLNKQINVSIVSRLADEMNEPKVSIDNRLLQIENESVETPCWTAHEISLALQGFNKYGTDFLAISQVLKTKSEYSVKSFYNYFKEHFNLDKLILNNPKELKTHSNQILNEMTKLNKLDFQESAQSTHPIAASEDEKPTVETKIEDKQEKVVQNKDGPDECIILDD